MHSAKDIFKLPNQHIEILIIDNIVEIQKKAEDLKPEAEERIVTVSK
jgi:ethanolamine utilization cobalamin adenosyltransferase